MRYFVVILFAISNFSVFGQSFYRFDHLTVDDGLSRNTVTCIIQDKYGFMWFGTYNGLNRYDGYSFKIYKTSLYDTTKISNNRIEKTAMDENGNIWFLTFDNVYNKYDYLTDNFTRHSRDELSEDFLSLFDKQQYSVSIGEQVIWERVSSGGIRHRDLANGDTLAFIHEPFNNNSLSDNEVRCLFLDNSNILWIGSLGGGIDKLDINQKQFFNYVYNPLNENSLQDPYIRAISEDLSENIWVGTHKSGICKIERATQTFTRITSNEGLSINNIRDLFTDSRGDVWVGFNRQGVVQKIEPETITITTYNANNNDSSGYNNHSTYSICEDEFGFIWFGGFGGISRYNPETNKFRLFSEQGEEPNLSSDRVRVIYQDNSKNIWIGTEGGGLNKMVRESAGSDDERITFVHFKHNQNDTNSLSDNRVYSICDDDDGILWIGTGLGLNRYDPFKKEFTIFTEEHRLPDVMIYGILKDKENNLWLSHSSGLTHFNPITNQIIRNYKKSDGLQGNQFSEDAYFKNKKGELFFGGNEGLTYFLPDSIHSNPLPPKVVFTSLSILNKEVEVGKQVLGRTILKESILNTKSIKLDHKHRTFTIEFAALHYSNPLGNKYKYMLEGFDESWNETDASKRYTSYSNLRGGDYTLLVIASNSDNEWTKEPIALEIHINPPFWQTWYFILFVLVLLSVLIIFILKQRDKKTKRDKLILQNKIKEVEKEVDKQKEEIVMQKQELKLRAAEEKDMRWYNEGLAKFSELISKNKGNVNKLSQAIISELVDYLGADQGGVYLINDKNETDIHFELTGSFAYDGQRLKEGKVELGEGQIGACYKEKKILQINNLPPTYTTIRSGLGKKSPRFLILVPLKNDDEVLGVIEIASFIRVKGVRIVFLEKFSENISAVLATERATEKIGVLYKKSQEQTENLSKKEEEMLQTLEEMRFATEEAKSREVNLVKKIEEKESLIKNLKEKLDHKSNSE